MVSVSISFRQIKLSFFNDCSVIDEYTLLAVIVPGAIAIRQVDLVGS